MEVPKGIIDKMVSTGSAEMEWVTHSVINRIEIERAPSFAEWVDAACGAFPAREYELLLLKNPLSTHDRPMSQQEEKRFKMLQEMRWKKCSARGT